MRHLTLTTTLAALALCAGASAASAHGLDPGQALLHLVGDTAHLKVLPPVEAFPWCEAARDGQMTQAQAHACRQVLLKHLPQVFSVHNERGEPGTPIFEDSNLAQSHHPDQAPGRALRFTLRYRWPAPPRGLTLRYARGDLGPLRVIASRLDPAQQAMEPAWPLELTQQQPQRHLWHTVAPAAAPQAPADPTPEAPAPSGPLRPLLALGLLGGLLLVQRHKKPRNTSVQTERTP
jgi:hypothetical protein